MTEDFVWAIDEDGKPCKCKAKPENRGKRNCKHRFHQEPGQSKSEFLKEHGISISIFEAEKVEVLPYRMTEEEKDNLLKIEKKKDFLAECDDGAYFELEEALWNDMDKNYYSKNFGMKKADINAVLMEEKLVVIQDSGDFKAGDVFDTDKRDELINDGVVVYTGVEAMNYLAEQHGWHATKDIYVLPYYMRQGTPTANGDVINSDETEAYLRIFSTKKYSMKSRQRAYDALISNPDDVKRDSLYKRKSLADRLSGKKGIWRKEVTGNTIPYTGRAVAVPDTTIAYDEIKLPPMIAVDIFRPTIQENLKKNGFTPEQINEVIRDAKGKQENVTSVTRNLIQNAISEGNVRVILNRQPTLHSASMQGFKPIVSNNAAIGTNPLIAKGFNLDHDGDTGAVIGINSSYIAEKVDKELHPSNFKFTPKKQDELMMKPTKDALFGIMSVLKNRTN